MELKKKFALIPVASFATLPAFAGDFSAAVTAAATKVTGMTEDVVAAFTAMLGVAALIWVGRRVVGLFGR